MPRLIRRVHSPSTCQSSEPPSTLARHLSGSFTFRKPEGVLCNVSGEIEGWMQYGSDPSSSESSRYLLWLEKNGLPQDVYQALAPLDLSRCPADEIAGAELVLEGGDEHADRVEL